MASSDLTHFTGLQEEASEEEKPSLGFKDMLLSLPRERGWRNDVYLFQGFWCPSTEIQGINTFMNHFQAKDSDVVVATLPKSGTTWLKALTFAIVNRQRFSSFENHPLLTSNPHQLVPYFEFDIYGNTHDQILHKSDMIIEPRLFATHIHFHVLTKSIKESNCRIIYICRNPFDVFVSSWTFVSKIKEKSLPVLTLEEAFEKYCKGIIGFGPWWNHMLGYWKESIARPNKVLFLKYEDLKEDVNFHVRRVAEFLGCPFTQEEESNGVIESIIKLCSFEKMKDLEINKSGALSKNIKNKYFFRKGEIGDWKNYLSPSMAEKLSNIIEEKLSGPGLSFRYCTLNTAN